MRSCPQNRKDRIVMTFNFINLFGYFLFAFVLGSTIDGKEGWFLKMHHYFEGEAYCAQILAFPTGVTPILQLGLSFYSHVSEPGARRMDPLVDRQC